MWKKELRLLVKPTLGYLCILLAVPLLSLFKVRDFRINGVPFLAMVSGGTVSGGGGYWSMFLFFFAVILMVIANHYGFSMFAPEHKDGAFEYMMTFPMSRRRLFWRKLAPRLTVLAGLLSVYLVSAVLTFGISPAEKGKFYMFVDPLFMPLWVLFLLLAGGMLSFFQQKNIMAVVTEVTILAVLFIPIGLYDVLDRFFPSLAAEPDMTSYCLAFGVLAILVILGSVFVPVYRRFDMRGMGYFGKKYALRVLPPLGILALAGLAMMIAFGNFSD